METENERDLSDMYYELIIFEINRDNRNINQFDNETLFMNIYNFYCFSHYLSQRSLQKHKFSYFCTECKNTYCKFFECLMVLKRKNLQKKCF